MLACRRHTAKILAAKSQLAKSEFTPLCMPGRISEQEELTSYKQKYLPLVKDINTFKEKLLADDFVKEYKLNEFVSFFDSIERLFKENNQLYNQLCIINSWVDLVQGQFDSFFDKDHFFTFSEKQNWLDSNKYKIELFKSIYSKHSKLVSHPFAQDLYKRLLNLEGERSKHNSDFKVSQIVENENFFDTIHAYPLDMQQRRAIVTLEDNALVISSAGSGKTSTIIGKARYLLDKRNVDPKKLLVITYTRKAASELLKRLNNEEVHCSTFHSLAVEIIAKVSGKRPTICESSLLFNSFRYLLEKDHEFVSNMTYYILHLQSLMKLEHEYQTAYEYFADRKKYGIQAPYPDCNGNVIWTKSEEEKRICILLTELGVNFEYESPYEYWTQTPDYRQYKPDFTIYVDEEDINPNTGEFFTRKRKVYLEHFAINAYGQVPKWFGGDDSNPDTWEKANIKYNDGIRWKRNLHKEKGTTLIETKSADFHSGNIEQVLVQQLTSANVPINRQDPEDLYERLVKRQPKVEKGVFKLLEQFIALLKSNCTTLDSIIKNVSDDIRSTKILKCIIKPLLDEYSKRLLNRGEIDFTDAILEASRLCTTGAWTHYDYILIDEFQDISVDRYKFIDSLRTKSPLTKLFCVGDDWQSIYRFCGSNMKLFYKFEEFFGFTEQCKIETTYRFFNPLLDISSNFIQQNPEQKKKYVKPIEFAPPTGFEPSLDEENVYCSAGYPPVVISVGASKMTKFLAWKHLYESSIHFIDCGATQKYSTNMLPFVQSIVSSIPSDQSIIIIARYNYDVDSLGYDFQRHNFNEETIEVTINNRKITFMSVHSAKGLEADNVILINCNEGIYGFPSLIEDDPILDYVLSEEDKFEYAEERRLFYVAITRARKNMYVLYNNDKPSPFVRELTNVLKENESLCPLCKQGHIVIISEKVAVNGNKYVNYGCSNSNAGCQYFERVFEGNVPRFRRLNQQ
jgi:DNA helicase-4